MRISALYAFAAHALPRHRNNIARASSCGDGHALEHHRCFSALLAIQSRLLDGHSNISDIT